MSDLFAGQRLEYGLFDSSTRRFIPKVRCSMTDTERVQGDEYFAKLRCGHLQWKPLVESNGGEVEQGSEPVQKMRSYTIKR